MIVGFPVWQQLAMKDGGDAPQRRLRHICEKLDLPFIDMLPIYKGNEPPSEALAELYMEDQSHPSVLGHQMAAQALFEFLESERYVERFMN